MTIILVIVSIAIAYFSAPKGNSVKTIDSFDVQFEEDKPHEENQHAQAIGLKTHLF